MQTGARIALRDYGYGQPPLPSVTDVLVESGQVSTGYANFLQAIGTVLEDFTRKHFPQGAETPPVRGYRNKPYKPRRKSNGVNIIPRYDAFRRSKRDVVINLTPANEAAII